MQRVQENKQENPVRDPSSGSWTTARLTPSGPGGSSRSATGRGVPRRLGDARAPDATSGARRLVLDWLMPGVAGSKSVASCARRRRPPGARDPVADDAEADDADRRRPGRRRQRLSGQTVRRPRAARAGRRAGALEQAARTRPEGRGQRAAAAGARPRSAVGVDSRQTSPTPTARRSACSARTAPRCWPAAAAEMLPALPPDQLVDAARTSRPLADIQIGEQMFSPTIRSLAGDDRARMTIALRDVTARRRNESRRLDFYSIIAHDLRSPLGAMLMRTDMLLRGQRGRAVGRGDLRSAQDGRQHAAPGGAHQRLPRLRAHGRGGAQDGARPRRSRGRGGGDRRRFRPLVENAGSRSASTSRGRGPWSRATGRLQQVLTNLVANAVKFTLPTGTWCCTRARTVAGARSASRTTAPGSRPRPCRRCSSATRAPPTSRRTRAAPGLGLLIVREIVEAHGGTVGVESTPGQGSRFWFRIPASEARGESSQTPIQAS